MGCTNSTPADSTEATSEYEKTVNDYNHTLATVRQPRNVVIAAMCLLDASDYYISAQVALDVATTNRKKAWNMLGGHNATDTYQGQGIPLFVASQVDLATAVTTHKKAWCKLADATADHNAAVKASANFPSSWKAFVTARARFQTCLRIEETE